MSVSIKNAIIHHPSSISISITFTLPAIRIFKKMFHADILPTETGYI